MHRTIVLTLKDYNLLSHVCARPGPGSELPFKGRADKFSKDNCRDLLCFLDEKNNDGKEVG